MTANPLKGRFEQSERIIPPQGDSDEAKAERQRFWIDHGNSRLAAEGKGHLHWVCIHGNYFIEERSEAARRAMLSNPNYSRAA